MKVQEGTKLRGKPLVRNIVKRTLGYKSKGKAEKRAILELSPLYLVKAPAKAIRTPFLCA